MTAIHYRSAQQLSEAIRDKEVGCVELLDHFLGRVARFNPALNAIICLDAERARKRARAADAALAKGELWGPLHGLPMTIKESYDITGLPTTWGVPLLRDNIATENAHVVERLLAAGAVLFGKTNVPIYLADWQSYNEIYGTTNNPWNLELTPGGSSGGSAAALATGMCGLEAGSDIGASIRNPAHFCGVLGHKPTWGIVPPRGQAMPGTVVPSDISVVGPLARSAEDLALALDVMAGPDTLDDVAWRLELPGPRRTRLRDFRVAVKLDDENAPIEAEYKNRLAEIAQTLARAGATVSNTAEPEIDNKRAWEVYILMLRAATSRRSSDEDVERMQQTAIERGPDDPSYLARMARGVTLPHRDWLQLHNERMAMRLAWDAFFRDWDVLICPAALGPAWPHDQAGERHDRTITVNNREVPTTDQMFWAGYPGLVNLPATVAPIGLTGTGLPLGVQVIAGHLEDKTAIEFCRLLAQEIGGFQPPPGYE